MKPKAQPKPLLHPSDAVAAIIKAACDFRDAVDDCTKEMLILEKAVDEYRRSQRDYVPPEPVRNNIDDLRRRF